MHKKTAAREDNPGRRASYSWLEGSLSWRGEASAIKESGIYEALEVAPGCWGMLDYVGLCWGFPGSLQLIGSCLGGELALTPSIWYFLSAPLFALPCRLGIVALFGSVPLCCHRLLSRISKLIFVFVCLCSSVSSAKSVSFPLWRARVSTGRLLYFKEKIWESTKSKLTIIK